jgi:hypothetical protein
MQRLARDFMPQGTLIPRGIASDPNEDSRDRIVAIGMLLDRAWGKVPDCFDPATEEPRDDTTRSAVGATPQKVPVPRNFRRWPCPAADWFGVVIFAKAIFDNRKKQGENSLEQEAKAANAGA